MGVRSLELSLRKTIVTIARDCLYLAISEELLLSNDPVAPFTDKIIYIAYSMRTTTHFDF